MKTGIWLILATLLAACATPPTPAPVPTRVLQPAPAQQDTAFVFLPGIGGRVKSFVKHDFGGPAREHLPGFHLLATDLHRGYYAEDKAMERLDKDVIQPLRADGYRNIWLVGISMGGLGAVDYANRHPEKIAGLILIAPFLGDESITEVIQLAGGPEDWFDNGQPDLGNPFADSWRWLVRNHRASKPQKLPIFLLRGVDDKYAETHQMVQSLVPAGHVVEGRGKHRWQDWQRLWQTFFGRGLHEQLHR